MGYVICEINIAGSCVELYRTLVEVCIASVITRKQTQTKLSDKQKCIFLKTKI